jgi:hypothetical protein
MEQRNGDMYICVIQICTWSAFSVYVLFFCPEVYRQHIKCLECKDMTSKLQK